MMEVEVYRDLTKPYNIEFDSSTEFYSDCDIYCMSKDAIHSGEYLPAFATDLTMFDNFNAEVQHSKVCDSTHRCVVHFHETNELSCALVQLINY